MKGCEVAVRRQLQWLLRSGIMAKEDGSAGVYDRLVYPGAGSFGSASGGKRPRLRKWQASQRRTACCNFECAALFLLANDLSESGESRRIGENILGYLYRDSGMKTAGNDEVPQGIWKYCDSEDSLDCRYWLDDNGKIAQLQFLVGHLFPEVNAKFSLCQHALDITDQLHAAAERMIPDNPNALSPSPWLDGQGVWTGDWRRPHWGGVATLALIIAMRLGQRDQYGAVIEKYLRYAAAHAPEWNNGELVKIATAALFGAEFIPDGNALALHLSDLVMRRMNPRNGNFEAQLKTRYPDSALVDLVHTVNWALFYFQNLANCFPSAARLAAYQQLVELIVSIQDSSDDPLTRGSWHSVFHLGKGDYIPYAWSKSGLVSEIYSGWTNATLGIALSLASSDTSMRRILE